MRRENSIFVPEQVLIKNSTKRETLVNTSDSRIYKGFFKMEHTGFEPVASTMRMLRAPNCANAPHNYPFYHNRRKSKEVFHLFCVPVIK